MNKVNPVPLPPALHYTLHTILFWLYTGNHTIAAVRAKESYPALAEGLAEVIAEINSVKEESVCAVRLGSKLLVKFACENFTSNFEPSRTAQTDYR